ncbi:flagellar MS-ring protein [Legionella geestiana]|uniref:Flagellar M-ring protein n=1 Tax=Legionella geestiana TaxID=45065 RepID=A0A0W0TWK9_9GAMM|nr:flagellar basal-body MS-ring/collar protein FliF [Legionella geestiana]KTD00115.1 flagellar MS-ring protein [Legionella geestiana]QBS11839.1 flagellar M-ring protein FliF [Legionella geestiana]QDQ40546.1 flagellar M-ring protein FliF [Legionella geestiana]STX53466.1 flagellar M-ring protein FliF [Legionella geestiana]
MEKNLDAILETVKTIFGFDVVKRLFFLGAIAASVAVGFGLYQWAQEPLYRPLFSGLTPTNLAATVDTLEKARIPYKIDETTSSLSVPAKDVAQARMKLAAAGVSNDDGFNFAFLNDQNKIGANPFLENARYIRALESDLAKTIAAIQGISSARVHIAIPKQNVYTDENAKTTASIILNLTPGYEGDKEKIRAIIQLVAASVPELDPTNVAITDQYGHYLSAINDDNELLSQEQLTYQNTIQRYYEKRIQGLLTPMLGANKTRVSVNADIDFTQQEEAREQFDPAASVVRSEESVNESNGGGGASGVPGALSNQPPANGGSNQQQPASGGQSRNESVKNYEVSKTMRYSRVQSPKLKKLTVAVVLDDDIVFDEKTKKSIRKPLDKEKMDKITELVQSAIGFSADRGDRVTVINSGFSELPVEKEIPTPLWEQPWFWELVKRIGGMLAGFVLLAVLVRKILQHLRPKSTGLPTTLAADGTPQLITPEMFELKNEQIKILKELASQDPNKVASVIRRWINK